MDDSDDRRKGKGHGLQSKMGRPGRHELRGRNRKRPRIRDGRRARRRRAQPRPAADGNGARGHRRLHRLRCGADPEKKRAERLGLRGAAHLRARGNRPESLHQDPHAFCRARPESETVDGGERDQAFAQQVLLGFDHARQDRDDHARLRDHRKFLKGILSPRSPNRSSSTTMDSVAVTDGQRAYPDRHHARRISLIINSSSALMGALSPYSTSRAATIRARICSRYAVSPASLAASAIYSFSDFATTSSSFIRFMTPLAKRPRMNRPSQATMGRPHSTACIAVLKPEKPMVSRNTSARFISPWKAGRTSGGTKIT